MTPIRELQEFRKDCKRFQEAISKSPSNEIKTKITSLYKDFLIKAEAVDRNVQGVVLDYKESSFSLRFLVTELTQSRMRIENFINEHID
jgi:hypothetical protein